MRNSDKDRLIIALGAQLRAERQTREALAAVIGNGQIDREVLLAILADPIPASSPHIGRVDMAPLTQDDLVKADRFALAGPHPRARAA
ncbi:hypothetical protein IP69_12315 [Bosea sp. AAP35]|uniref:hypothetical protein n=1 Tax=Bosea sp. AAP35 TaxID=1523417 RepID=UPI0006B91693|nr:hypothetical protein [Bosea sp. AAP35]KPF67828.1 hypothetical protein IP69_12315 [Bosea sp. AAP35]